MKNIDQEKLNHPYLIAKLPGDDLSLKDLILKVKEYAIFVLFRWKFILLIGLIGAFLGFVFAKKAKKKYEATLTFILEDHNDNSSGALGDFGGLASQLGIHLPSSKQGIFSETNLIAFLKSRLMIEKTLLSTVASVGTNPITLAQWYYDILNLQKRKDTLREVIFPPGIKKEQLILKQDSILHGLYERIVNKNINVKKLDRKNNFITISCIISDGDFANLFVRELVKQVTDFYVFLRTSKSKDNIALLENQIDSLTKVLKQQTYLAAAIQDENINLARQVARIRGEEIMRNRNLTLTLYIELVKSLNLARLNVIKETPILQIIDEPALPLQERKMSVSKGIVIGACLGGLLASFIILISKVYHEIMNS